MDHHNSHDNKKNEQVEIKIQNQENENIKDRQEKISAKETLLEEKFKDLEKKLEENINEATLYKDNFLRLRAEFDNYRRRTSKEKDEVCSYASEKIMQELLPVLDSFDKAICSIPKDISQNMKSFIDGINMTYKNLKTTLEKEGLKEIIVCGESFNPDIHEALQIVECSDHPHECVIEEFQKGYYLKNKILRHPKVKVAKNISELEKVSDEKQNLDENK